MNGIRLNNTQLYQVPQNITTVKMVTLKDTEIEVLTGNLANMNGAKIPSRMSIDVELASIKLASGEVIIYYNP